MNQNVEKVLVDDAITEKNNTQTVLDISDEMPHQEEPCKQVFFIEEASHEAAPMETVPVEETIKEGVSVQAAPEEKKSGFVDKSVTEGKAYESMTIEELQEAILSKMEKNGPVTEQMLRSVQENVYPNSLLNWVKSFR